MAKKAPEFIKVILDIDKAGFDCDYISDKYLRTCTFKTVSYTHLKNTQ